MFQSSVVTGGNSWFDHYDRPRKIPDMSSCYIAIYFNYVCSVIISSKIVFHPKGDWEKYKFLCLVFLLPPNYFHFVMWRALDCARFDTGIPAMFFFSFFLPYKRIDGMNVRSTFSCAVLNPFFSTSHLYRVIRIYISLLLSSREGKIRFVFPPLKKNVFYLNCWEKIV